MSNFTNNKSVNINILELIDTILSNIYRLVNNNNDPEQLANIINQLDIYNKKLEKNLSSYVIGILMHS